jgi:hypothetical protein
LLQLAAETTQIIETYENKIVVARKEPIDILYNQQFFLMLLINKNIDKKKVIGNLVKS